MLVVEIHVPLVATATDGYAYPWIDGIEELLFVGAENGAYEVYDDGEELDGEYLFFVTGADESTLVAVASTVARHPGVPDGVYARVTDDEADMGTGRRVEVV